MRFPREFDIHVTDEIIDESVPGDAYCCAIANAVKYNLPFEKERENVEVTYGNCNVEEDKVLIEAEYLYWDRIQKDTDESICFQFVMDDALIDWMDTFDKGLKVSPIIIATHIDVESLGDIVVGTVYGKMNLKEMHNENCVLESPAV